VSVNIDEGKLRSLLEILSELEVAEFEHEADGVRVRVVRGAAKQVAHVSTAPVVPPPRESRVEVAPAKDDGDAFEVTCPFVGTFYRSPSPESPSYVDVGSVVRVGQTLCIVEAMKLMNEIECDVAGTIVAIYAENGKSVEFGQKLFRIKKA
jgi:acetyl-CoA carboxylase biotin carboxyl carrier protein